MKTKWRIIVGSILLLVCSVITLVWVAIQGVQWGVNQIIVAAQATVAAVTPVAVDGWLVKAFVLMRTEYLGLDAADEGNEFVVVMVAITNQTDQRISYSPAHFLLRDSNGTLIEPSLDVRLTRPLKSGELAPRKTASGSLAFEVPEGAVPLTLIWTGNRMLTTEQREIPLP